MNADSPEVKAANIRRWKAQLREQLISDPGADLRAWRTTVANQATSLEEILEHLLDRYRAVDLTDVEGQRDFLNQLETTAQYLDSLKRQNITFEYQAENLPVTGKNVCRRRSVQNVNTIMYRNLLCIQDVLELIKESVDTR